MKKSICNLIILDASGSMTDKAAEVRHGLLGLFQDIKENAQLKHRTIVTDFSSADDFNILVSTKNTDKLSREVADSYRTRGMTALYDAIGRSFALVDKKYDGVFVSIMTDGLENNSQKFSLEKVRKLIAKKRNQGWAITFMGTTESALKEAQSMGVPSGNTYMYEDSVEGIRTAQLQRKQARSKFSDMVFHSDVTPIEPDALMEDND